MAKPKTKEEQAEQEERLRNMGKLIYSVIEEIPEVVEKEIEPIEEGGKKDAKLRRPNSNK